MNSYEKYNLNKYNGLNNCFFSSAITICDYFGVDECKKGIALLYPYSIGNTTPIQLSVENNGENISELLNLSCVNYLTRNCQTNLIGTIINDLDEKKPVMLYIDCFYDSMSKFSFGRFHLRHYIIVCDYIVEENSFWIVQHDYANENTYTYRKISFKELENCYYGGLKHFKQKKSTYFWFYKSNDKDLHTKSISNNSLLYEYKHSTDVLEQFLQFFFVCVKENVSDVYLAPFVKNFNEILQVKKTLATFYINEVGESDNLTQAVSKIAYAWEQLYQIVKNESRTINDISKSISDIIGCESGLCIKLGKLFE
ncbi:MAG: hypothetical protein E7388_06945 [Ruminococcaceae bacterium]|nr:hypothetical protein [Oscillospiraceae bacterium]